MKSWLKGGVIGIGISLIFTIFTFFKPLEEKVWGGCAQFVCNVVYNGKAEWCGLECFLVIPLMLCVGFLVGIFMGWMYGKIKSE